MEIDFTKMPSSYQACWHQSCPLAANCLRSLASSHIGTDRAFVSSVNLNAVHPEEGKCKYQRPVKIIRNAYGLKHIYDNVPHAKHKAIYSRIHYGIRNTTYYDYYNERKPIPPEIQEYIQQVFADNGIKEPVVFRRYEDAIDW